MFYTNSANFKRLLLKLLDENVELTEATMLLAEQFLFQGTDLPARKIESTLLNTLQYLKRLMKRNGMKSLEDLEDYYSRLCHKAVEVFDKLNETDPEECFALHFKQAYTIHMKTVRVVKHDFKSNCLYYLSSHVEFTILDPQETYQLNIPFQSTWQQEKDLDKHFMWMVKGNHLALDEKKSGTNTNSWKEIVSN